MANLPARGLYAITDRHHCALPSILSNVEQAVRGGAVIVQYRDKGTDTPRRKLEASQILEICRDSNVPLIINDDVSLAKSISADGVHVGKDDGTLANARAQLGPNAIVGVSCYNSVELALSAQRGGADYIAFGRFFPSSVKPNAIQASLEQLRQNRPRFTVPVVAIGGITPENANIVLDAGADLLAVINAVFGTDDPRYAASRFSKLFPQQTSGVVDD